MVKTMFNVQISAKDMKKCKNILEKIDLLLS